MIIFSIAFKPLGTVSTKVEKTRLELQETQESGDLIPDPNGNVGMFPVKQNWAVKILIGKTCKLRFNYSDHNRVHHKILWVENTIVKCFNILFQVLN